MVNRAAISRTIMVGLIGAATASLAGCGFVPEGRLGECHKMSRTLQAENARLKDKYLTADSQLQEAHLRELDNQRQIRADEDVIKSLQQSVAEYQKDREEMEKAIARMKSAVEGINSQVRVSDEKPRAQTEGDDARSLAARTPEQARVVDELPSVASATPATGP